MTSRTSFDKSIISSPPEMHLGQQSEISHNIDEVRHQASLSESQKLSDHDQSQSSESLQDEKKRNLVEKQKHREGIEKDLVEARELLESLQQREKDHVILQNQADLAKEDLEDKQSNANKLKEQIDKFERKREIIEKYHTDNNSLQTNLADLKKRKANFREKMDSVDEKIKTITSHFKDASTVENLALIPECEGILTKEDKEYLRGSFHAIENFEKFHKIYHRNDTQSVLCVDEDAKKYISEQINPLQKSYEPFVKLPEVTSLYNPLPSKECIHKEIQKIVLEGDPLNHIVERKRQIDSDQFSETAHAINQKFAQDVPNLRLLDPIYCKSQKEALEGFIEGTKKIMNNSSVGKITAYKYYFESIKEMMHKECPDNNLYKNSKGAFDEKKAPGFSAMEKLYTECISTSEFNEALQNAEQSVKKLEKRISWLNENPKIVEDQKRILQDRIRSGIQKVLEADKQHYTQRKLFQLEMDSFLDIHRNLKDIATRLVEKHKNKLISPLHEKQAQYQKNIADLQIQIRQIEESQDIIKKYIRNKKWTKSKEEQLHQIKEAYDNAKKEVIAADRAFKKAAQATRESFDLNLKNQINQARLQYKELEEQLETALQEEEKAKLIHKLATNPLTQSAIKIFDGSSDTGSSRKKIDTGRIEEDPHQLGSAHGSGRASNIEQENLGTQSNSQEASQKSSIDELQKLLRSIQERRRG